MAKLGAIFGWVFIAFLVLYSGSKNTNAQLCCNNHPELGSCEPGVDDASDGKCWLHCIAGCEKGGFCKQLTDKNVCHCYC
ncbi:putative defensin-like protein 20 [Cucumis melo var. makuwa]|uniref:Putative defensin-like protein 20 n=1 Tax=Cucumis melo var. makuwa TaxID=1194695 RepID=A0A5D3CFQ3_CUCMM|nr:putative defensin-like protein 20 [Cucumis melo var. makuwa]